MPGEGRKDAEHRRATCKVGQLNAEAERDDRQGKARFGHGTEGVGEAACKAQPVDEPKSEGDEQSPMAGGVQRGKKVLDGDEDDAAGDDRLDDP